jgi:outer membrane protein assembly factor BamD (BamD/ComL family)
MTDKKFFWIYTVAYIWLASLSATASGADLQKAKSLYKAGNYIESIANCSLDSDAAIYQIYLNEKEIGARADYEATLPDSPKAKYIQYVKKNPTQFIYNEAAGGTYGPSNARYNEIRKLAPGSKYLGLIEYDNIQSFDASVWEDGDGSAHSKEIVTKYSDLIKRYPDAAFVESAKQRLRDIKVSHKRITGRDL